MLCTDKTGTLTENRMTIADVRPAAVVLRTGGAVSEVGTDQVVSFGRLASQIQPFDRMELAFHLRAKQLAFEDAVGEHLAHQYPFSSGMLAMTNVWRQPDGSLVAAAKGAPEAIAGLCRFASENRVMIAQSTDQMARQGMRVLRVAKAVLQGDPIHFSPRDATSAVKVVGLDDQREIGRDADHACDLQCGPRFGKVAHSAIDDRSAKRDCSCF